jgi:hypothetical protein
MRRAFAIALGAFLAGGTAWADVGVTLQTTKSEAYKGTAALTPAIVGKLKGGAANSDSIETIGASLRKLKDGDILVLAMHSNPKVFAIGDKVHPWATFWSTFGIQNPPRLAAAILGGCMFEEGDDNKIRPITGAQVRTLRAIFNAEIIYTPRGAIQFYVALNDTNGLLGSLLADKKLKDIDLQGRWNQNVSARWLIQNRWSTASLNNLRRVNQSSRAYEAGVDAGLGQTNPDGASLASAPGYELGKSHAGQQTTDQATEYNKVRKLIMESQ